jgi:hypothetical protein
MAVIAPDGCRRFLAGKTLFGSSSRNAVMLSRARLSVIAPSDRSSDHDCQFFELIGPLSSAEVAAFVRQ